jgi:tyrosyl-tRNA synthetase
MDIIAELQWRGLIADCTDLEGLRKRLEKPVTLYCGFDPTADSLHVGNLVPLLGLRRFQLAGHNPIALAGGATGLVGDPGGKSSERPLLSREALRANLEGIKPQLEKLLDFACPNAARLVDNADWTAPMSCLDFLREVGKHFPVNYMISKEWVKTRLEGDGISYTELSYMLIQAHDFYHLNKALGCELQVAGTDQWGNITAGTELCRRKEGRTVFGLTFPLLLNADGTKFGKSVAGAVWLDPKKTTPEAFYQFWFNSDDRDVVQRLKFFTFLSREEIADLEARTKEKPQERAAQKALADAVTKLAHGEEMLRKARPAEGENIFNVEPEKLRALAAEAFAQACAGLPSAQWKGGEWPSVLDLLECTKLASSKSDGRRACAEGGVYLNKVVEKDPARKIAPQDLLHNAIVVSRGKKNYAVVLFGSR